MKITFKNELAFRFDVIFNMLFTVIKILFAYILWGAIFGSNKLVAGFTYDTMLSYYIISSFLSQIELSDGVSGEISARIRNGTFSKYMVLPAHVEAYFLVQTLGATAFYLSFDFIAALIWIFIFHIEFAFTGSLFLIVIAFVLILQGLVFMVQLNYLLGILTFKFQDIQLFLMIKNNLVAFITGALIPLALLPEVITAFMRFFPFYYVTYLPSMLLIGRNGEEAITGVLVLGGWMVVLFFLNRFLYNRLRRKYDGVGI
jgi:ABC-2 type transport system permease protein